MARYVIDAPTLLHLAVTRLQADALPNLEAEAQFNEALLTFLGRHAP